MFNRSYCDRKSQLSGILTEPLNPRALKFSKKILQTFILAQQQGRTELSEEHKKLVYCFNSASFV